MGCPGVVADGMNVVKVFEAAAELIDAARKGKGPALLELKTWRYRGHFEGEPATYRTREEEEGWLKKDPLAISATALSELKVLDTRRIEEIKKEVDAELSRAVDFARSSPFPEPADALLDVFA